MKIEYTITDCSLGRLLVAATEAGVCFVAIGGQTAALICDLSQRFRQAELVPAEGERLEQLAESVRHRIDNPAAIAVTPPLDIRGTAFQHRVWDALRRIAPGETVSYELLAQRIGRPGASRAVAGACARNPVAVLVPCHRVVRADGGLGGYRWGLDRKHTLLAREGAMRDAGQALRTPA